MINKVEINNFQSHNKSVLEFEPGLNVIIGSSDSGKSAIIRALRWVTWNRPAGENMKSHWGGECRVAVHTEHDCITRERGKENLYQINDTSFTAFGNEVPEEVRNTLQLNEINLQQQLDAPFLLCKSAGEVALHFNKIAHLEKIHIGQKNIEKWLRQVQIDVESKKTQLSEKETELKGFEYLERLEKDIEGLEGMQEQLTGLHNAKSKLNQLVGDIEEVEQELTDKSQILEAENSVNSILQLYEEVSITQQRKLELRELYQDISTINETIESNKILITDENKINDLLQLMKQQTELRTEGNTLFKLIKSIKETRSDLVSNRKILKEKETEFTKQFPDICPLCNTNLKH